MTRKLRTIIGLSVIANSALLSRAADTSIEQMPAKLETQYAFSALPPTMRDHATVYLLDPKKGYQLSQQGTSGMTCLVERTAWEQADFRNDIYVPLCYDAEGSKTFLRVIMDVAALRIQGMSPSLSTVKWPVRRTRSSLFVPKTSVVTTTERTFVIRNQGGHAEWVDVKKGVADGNLVEVMGNLKAGDTVVRRATDEIRDGASIQALPRSK